MDSKKDIIDMMSKLPDLSHLVDNINIFEGLEQQEKETFQELEEMTKPARERERRNEENLSAIKRTTEYMASKLDTLLVDVNYLIDLTDYHVDKFEDFTQEQKADFEIIKAALSNREKGSTKVQEIILNKGLDYFFSMLFAYIQTQMLPPMA